MTERKPTEIPKSIVSFAWMLLKTWWTLVPVAILSCYVTISGLVKASRSVRWKTWWDGLTVPSLFGWQTLAIIVLVSLIVVLIVRSFQMLQSQAEEISEARNAEGWLALSREARQLEEEIAALEKLLPESKGVWVTPAVKVGKDEYDFRREKIARKKAYLKEVKERMKR